MGILCLLDRLYFALGSSILVSSLENHKALFLNVYIIFLSFIGKLCLHEDIVLHWDIMFNVYIMFQASISTSAV